MSAIWEVFIALFVNTLLWIYDIVGHNFGLAIILFTILIRLITWPLNSSQMKGAQAMQSLQNDKEWLEIQKKYAKDREKLAQEQMRIYQERGINPFGSCLPMLIQFPIIIALYQSISRAMASTPLGLLQLGRSLYSFLNVETIIPLNSKFLWMDLGRPEAVMLFGIGIPTLAIIVGLSTYVQSKLTMPSTPSTGPNDQAAAMSSSMAITMPIMMAWITYGLPAGVGIYFVTSNLLGVAQYAMMGKVNWRNLLPGGNQPTPPARKK
ncbi:MAG: YidC/Oxa1 family membrane protein insertase [Chloroflexota bacterium]|jgi:YidC/Oxa1 family membrane protein insertase